jgi:hypothetical protein
MIPQSSLAQSHQARLPHENSSFGPTTVSTLGHNLLPNDPPQPWALLNQPMPQIAPDLRTELESLGVRRRMDSSRMPLPRPENVPVSPVSLPNREVIPHNNSPSVQSGIALPPSSQSGWPTIPSSSSPSVLGPGRVPHLGAPTVTLPPIHAPELNQGNLREQDNGIVRPSALSLRPLTAEARSSSPSFGSLKPVHLNNIGARALKSSGGSDFSMLTPSVKVEQVSGSGNHASGCGVPRLSNHVPPPIQDLPSKESPAVIVKDEVLETTATTRPEALNFGLPGSSSTPIAPPSQGAAPSHITNATSIITGVGAPRAQSSFAPETAAARSAQVIDRATSAPGSMRTTTGIDGAHVMDAGSCTGHAAAVPEPCRTSAVDTAAESAIADATVASNEGLPLSRISSTGNVSSATLPHESSLEDGEILDAKLPTSRPEDGGLVDGKIFPATETPGQPDNSNKELNASQDSLQMRAASRDLRDTGPSHSGRSFPFVQAQSSRTASASSPSTTQIITDSRLQINQSSLTMDISDDEVDQLLQDRASNSSGLDAGARELEATQSMVCPSFCA